MSSEPYWRPYQPSPVQPWNLKRVVHLHRRAAWGATWDEIERDLAGGPEQSISRLLAPRDGVNELERLGRELEERAVAQQQIGLLEAGWMMRMWHSNDPLGEQLTLMWHNHFATSQLKVRDVAAMRTHLETLRRYARRPFPELLAEMMRDPAMLVWLDADTNRKGRPNENLARELMELFTLGHGHYVERDVQDAARALTGWTTRDGRAVLDRELHDDGMKEILGHRGRHGLDELLAILTSHPAAYRRIAWRICDHFFGPDGVSQDGINELAEQIRASQWSIADAVATVVRSQTFFSDAQIGRRICSPASFVVATTRALEAHGAVDRAGVSPLIAAAWTRAMGQHLLHPPGVGGWPGGRSWLGPTAIVERARFGLHLASGSLHQGAPQIDLAQLIERRQSKLSPFDFAATVLFGGELAETVEHEETPLVASLLASVSAQFD